MILSDLYDADKRATDPLVREVAAKKEIPHPLCGVEYADGWTGLCTKDWCPRCGPVIQEQLEKFQTFLHNIFKGE